MARRPARRIAIIESFAARFDTRATLERQGQTIGAYDLMIAATARSQGLVLVTGNVRAFERVEELRVETWG